MAYRHKETVEISSKEEGFLGSYYRGTILAAIGKSRYLVQYQNRYVNANPKPRLLITSVDATEVRPLPPAPAVPVTSCSFAVTDRVDAYINNAWWVGKIVGKVDRKYIVRLENSGDEHNLFCFQLRVHLDWEDGNWVYPRTGVQTEDNQAEVGEQGS